MSRSCIGRGPDTAAVNELIGGRGVVQHAAGSGMLGRQSTGMESTAGPLQEPHLLNPDPLRSAAAAIYGTRGAARTGQGVDRLHSRPMLEASQTNSRGQGLLMGVAANLPGALDTLVESLAREPSPLRRRRMLIAARGAWDGQ